MAGKYPGHNKERNNEHLCTMLVLLEGMLEHIPWRKGEDTRKQACGLLDAWIEQAGVARARNGDNVQHAT